MHLPKITDAEPIMGVTEIALRVHVGKRRLSARVQIPSRSMPHSMPPLLALHGISRDTDAIMQNFGRPCARSGRVLIVPSFSEADWRHFQTIGSNRPDRALLALLDQVQALGLAQTDRVALFGYSGGAQLAHRFAMIYPQRVAALHVASAGWYCMPDHGLPFPMGLGQAETKQKFDAAALARGQLPVFLRLPIHVYVGSDDTDRDQALRKHPLIETAQGTHRLARGRRYAAALQEAAQARSLTSRTTFTELPDCAHSFSTCAQAGLAELVCTQ